MNYADKVSSVSQAYGTVQVALNNIPGVKFRFMSNSRVGLVSIYNVNTHGWDREALLNIFWDADHESPVYSLSTYPHSNVPFQARGGNLDYDEDGTIEIEDIVAIASELFGKLNE